MFTRRPLTPLSRSIIIMSLVFISVLPVKAALPGKDIFELKCAMCHELPAPAEMKGGKWPNRINEMIEFADLSDDEKITLQKYIQSLINHSND